MKFCKPLYYNRNRKTQCYNPVLLFWVLGLLCGSYFHFLSHSFFTPSLILSLFCRLRFGDFIITVLVPIVFSISALYLLPLNFFYCIVFAIAFINCYVFQAVMIGFHGASVFYVVLVGFAKFISIPFLFFSWLYYFRMADRSSKLIGTLSPVFVGILFSTVSYRWLFPLVLSVLNS